MSYDSWKTTPQLSQAHEYAQGIIDELTREEMVAKCRRYNLLPDDDTLTDKQMEDLLYSHYFEAYYNGESNWLI